MARSMAELGLAVRRLQVRQHRALDAALRPLGVSLVQWDALRNLATHPQASLRDLAALTYQSEQAFGTLAARMVAADLISRVDGPGRAIQHRITAHGEEVRRRGEEVVERVIATSFEPLDAAQVAELDALLEQLLPPMDPLKFGGRPA